MNTNVPDYPLQNTTTMISSPESTGRPYLSGPERVIVGLTTGILGLAGFSENIIVILFIIFTRGFLDVPSNIYLLSLATADVLLCGVTVPLFLCVLTEVRNFDYIINAVYNICAFATVGSIFLLTLNRVLSVRWGLKYVNKMSLRRAVLLVAAIWLMSFGILLMIIVSVLTEVIWLGRLQRYFMLIFLFLVLAMNIYLFRKSMKHRRQIQLQLKAVSAQMNSLQQDFKSVKTLFFVTGTFILGWLPTTLVLMNTDERANPNQYHRILSFTAPFPIANAALDPVIYFFRGNAFRQSCHRLKRLLSLKLNLTSNSIRYDTKAQVGRRTLQELNPI